MAEDDFSESDLVKGIKKYQRLYDEYQKSKAQNLEEEAIALPGEKSETIFYIHVSLSDVKRTNFPTPR